MAIALAFRLLCLALGCSLSSLFAVVAAAEGAIPRVALLFITRAHMPLERVWHEFFRSVEGLRPPALWASQLADVMEDKRVLDVEQKLRNVGSFSQNTLLRDQDCVDNAIILVRLLWQLATCYITLPRPAELMVQLPMAHAAPLHPHNTEICPNV